MTNDYAPIVLFVYNRLHHTKKTIEALKKNNLATESDLFIFCDGAKQKNDEKVFEVQEFCKSIDGFNSVTVNIREENAGLAKSIIQGVTEIVNQYEKVIVLEDDIVTSPYFLSFMNQALDFYKDDKRVWHISGWNYPIETGDLDGVFFWRVMNCWGWATWTDRWSHFEKNPNRLINSWTKQQKHHFDLDGSGGFWSQVKKNANGKLNTWAIFWYATIYENEGFCLNPALSYVNNIGEDGSGENCVIKGVNTEPTLNILENIQYPSEVQECDLAVKKIKKHYRKTRGSFLVRIYRHIKTKLTKLLR
jgi:hypothetical protein